MWFRQRVPCAREKHLGEMQLGGRGVIEVGGRLQVLAERTLRRVQVFFLGRPRGENRRGTGAEESDALACAVRDGGKADDGVIAMPARELEERRALGRGDFGA